MATMENLQARIQRLEDIEEIEKLQGIYGYYRDYFEWEKIVDLFADQAESVEIADSGVYKGKEGVKRFYLKLMGAQKPRVGFLHIQMQLQGVVDVEPGGLTAKGRWYGFSMEALPTLSLFEGDLRQLWGHGIYENEYIKEGGKWKFKKLHYNLIFRTPFEDGWIKTPVVGQNGPSREVPPDAPPTAYHPFPSAERLPLHYKHPITGK
jgi:hypothetical protein